MHIYVMLLLNCGSTAIPVIGYPAKLMRQIVGKVYIIVKEKYVKIADQFDRKDIPKLFHDNAKVLE